MATLSDTAYVSRQAIQYIVAGLVALMVGRVLLTGMTTLLRRLVPPEPAPPTFGYGPLPPIQFPENPKELTYTLQTATGTLPAFGDRAVVYPVITSSPNLLSLDRASQKADALGFDGPAIKRSELLYLWEKSQPIPGRLNMFIYQGNFVMSLDWFEDPLYLIENKLPNDAGAVRNVVNFLGRADAMPDDLAEGDSRVSYLKARGSSYTRAVSLSEADFLQVDLFRAPIDEEFYSYTADPSQGLVRAVVGGGSGNSSIVNVEYNYFPLDTTQGHTYPLKSPSVAWEELANGAGYVARVQSDTSSVIVRRVELGYFDSYAPQEYIQPIYVFSGDDGFVGYVPALTRSSYMVGSDSSS